MTKKLKYDFTDALAKLDMFQRSQSMVYMMLKVVFDIGRKEIMKGKTMDEMAVIALERTLSAIKDDSLSPKQLRKLVALVNGEVKLEDNK